MTNFNVHSKGSDFTVAPTNIKVASLTQDDALALANRSAEAQARAVREHRREITGRESTLELGGEETF